MPALLLSRATWRRFILGQQGLWPGRRWQGKAGVAAALRHGCVVQIDPLSVVAHSHDLALQARVLDYQPDFLDELLFKDHAAFDYGGAVFIHPIQELPYWRVVMERNRRRERWATFAEQHSGAIAEVRAAITERGPLGGRDFKGKSVGRGNYRGTKDTGLALYYLWFSGELMTAGRRRSERLYDLRERIVPPEWNTVAAPDEADDFFALKPFMRWGLPTAREFRNGFAGMIERPVDEAEAMERLTALLAAGTIAEVQVEGQPTTQTRYVLSAHLPDLETLQAGRVPAGWQSRGPSTQDEMRVLAPLEIVSARGRAQSLFDFEYLWEVYKPASQRRWGYYTLPLLWGDRLVARFDSRLDRAGRTLNLLGFWMEEGVPQDEPFQAALRAGFRRFLGFLDVDRLQGGPAYLDLEALEL